MTVALLWLTVLLALFVALHAVYLCRAHRAARAEAARLRSAWSGLLALTHRPDCPPSLQVAIEEAIAASMVRALDWPNPDL